MRESTKSLVYVLLGLFVISCSSSSDSDETNNNPPSLPTAINKDAQPDLSFFIDNQPKVQSTTIADTSNYYYARNSVLGFSSFYTFGSVYSGFLQAANQQDATFTEGEWQWSYMYSYGNETAEILLTSREVADRWEWVLYLTYDDGQGNSYENYKVMEGTVSEDGLQGTWTFNSLNPETNQEVKAFDNSWMVTSDDEKVFSVKAYAEDGSVDFSADYIQNSSDYDLTYMFSDSNDWQVLWNTDSNIGSVDDGTEIRCWDENFVNAPCS